MKRAKNLEHVYRHFEERDPLLFPILSAMPLKRMAAERDASRYFARLCREIISQQLGSKAAAAIVGRFTGLFDGMGPTPAGVLHYTEQQLRDIGMSWAKARYVRDLAEKAAGNRVHLQKLAGLDDELVIAELTKIKGVGRWTAEMFLMFTLGRENIFSAGDLGLQKGLALVYGKRRAASPAAVARITGAWAPYRSYGSLAVWHVADNAKKQK